MFLVSPLSAIAEIKAPQLKCTKANETCLNHLALDPLWKRLIHYREATFSSSYESEVDEPEFFLAENGKSSPADELKAFIDQWESEPKNMGDKSLACRYPARTRFIQSRYPLSPKNIRCKKLDQWLEILAAKSVSLVFSSYYSAAPPSTFGHTFLKLNKHHVGFSYFL